MPTGCQLFVITVLGPPKSMESQQYWSDAQERQVMAGDAYRECCATGAHKRKCSKSKELTGVNVPRF